MTTTCPDTSRIAKSTIVRIIYVHLLVALYVFVGIGASAAEVQGLGTLPLALDPLALTPDMRRWVHSQVSMGTPPALRWRRLARVLVTSPELGLVETRLDTVTAAEAFVSRRVNCVAFAHLAAALAREVGLDVTFVLMRDIEDYEGRGDLRVAYGHLAVGFGPPEKRTVLDLGGLSRPSHKRMRAVSDRTALAVFYSNRGAEGLLVGDVPTALTWLRAAVRLDPELPRAWVNLGVAERRSGHPEAAAEAYHRALEIDPESLEARENLLVLKRFSGVRTDSRNSER